VQLIDLVGARHGFLGRQRRMATLFRLHRIIGTRTGPALRATLLYVLPVRLRPIIGPLLN
jgi:hypothetical protein